MELEANLITHWGDDLSAVNAARVSMDKESEWERKWADEETGFLGYEVLSDKDAKLVHYLAKNKHFSCFEHQGATLRLKVPLFVRSQIHRHRTFSYNEISRRYVKDNLEFYWPDKWRKAAENVKQGSSNEEHIMVIPNKGRNPTNMLTWAKDNVEDAIHLFNTMVEEGVCAEQARMLLPQNLYTSFYMTGNLRNWAHFLKLRLDPHAQKEVRDIAEMVAEILEPLFPVSYKALLETEA